MRTRYSLLFVMLFVGALVACTGTSTSPIPHGSTAAAVRMPATVTPTPKPTGPPCDTTVPAWEQYCLGDGPPVTPTPQS